MTNRNDCTHKYGFQQIAERGGYANAKVTVVCVEGCGEVRIIEESGKVSILKPQQ